MLKFRKSRALFWSVVVWAILTKTMFLASGIVVGEMMSIHTLGLNLPLWSWLLWQAGALFAAPAIEEADDANK